MWSKTNNKAARAGVFNPMRSVAGFAFVSFRLSDPSSRNAETKHDLDKNSTRAHQAGDCRSYRQPWVVDSWCQRARILRSYHAPGTIVQRSGLSFHMARSKGERTDKA